MDELLHGPVARIEVGELAPEVAGAAVSALKASGTGQVSYGDGEFIVPVASREELPRLVATLVGLGVPVYEAGLVRRSLEDAFVQLVRDHEAPAGDGQA